MLQAYQSHFLCPNVLPLYCLKIFPQTLSLPGRLSLPGVAELIDSQLSGQGVSYSSPYAPIRLCTSLSFHCVGNYGNFPNQLPGCQLCDGREHACHLTVNPARAVLVAHHGCSVTLLAWVKNPNEWSHVICFLYPEGARKCLWVTDWERGQDPLETEKGERRMEENNRDKIMEAQSLGSAALRSRSIGDREGRSPLPPHSPYSTAELQPSKGSGTIISSFHLLKASCVFIYITLFNYNKPVRWDALLSSF